MLGIYIRGSAPDRLIEQVTCGDVGIERAVVVPKVLFPLMLGKLLEFKSSKDYKTHGSQAGAPDVICKIFSAAGARKSFFRFTSRKIPV